ncbi:MAG: phosphopantetheine-binding protein, partial [Gimesia chilikensis]
MSFPALPQIEIEQKLLAVVSETLDIPLEKLSLDDRIIEDLRADSLELTELMMSLEDAFQITIPDDPSDPIHKEIFTRQPFRLCDLVELVTLQMGTRAVPRANWFRQPATQPGKGQRVPFTQLDGIGKRSALTEPDLFVPMDSTRSCTMYRRRTDGMRCIYIPADTVLLGSDTPTANPDERPLHEVELDSFLIDAEPVSTTAYCRFLNSIGQLPESF